MLHEKVEFHTNKGKLDHTKPTPQGVKEENPWTLNNPTKEGTEYESSESDKLSK